MQFALFWVRGLTILAKIGYDYLMMEILPKILFLQTSHYLTYLQSYQKSAGKSTPFFAPGSSRNREIIDHRFQY
jgi:hypothetical protein